MVLAKEKYGLCGRELAHHEAQFVPFTAQTRMSGVNLNGFEIRKGAADAIEKYLQDNHSALPNEVKATVERIARNGGTPLVVAVLCDELRNVVSNQFMAHSYTLPLSTKERRGGC